MYAVYEKPEMEVRTVKIAKGCHCSATALRMNWESTCTVLIIGV